MISSIAKWFAPPVFEGDEKKTYRVKLLNVTINLSVCFLVLVLFGNLLDRSTPPRNFVLDLIFIGMFLFLRRLLFADRVKWVGYFIIISAVILLTVFVSSEGTILAPATALFSLLVIMSGFIFNIWGIIAATIISSLVVAGLILAHQAGILPPPNYTESTFQWFVFTCTFGLTGWLAYFYNQLADQALERSRMEIRERERAEEKLRQQNDYLSILHQITLDLLNRRDMDELLQMIVDRAVILLDAPFGELMLEKDGELIVKTFTRNQEFLKGDRVGRAEAKLSWQAFDTKLPVVLEDYSTYPYRRDLYVDAGLRATTEFPVLVRCECIGVVSMGRSQPGYVFSEMQVEYGVLFAQLVALVLDSAQLLVDAKYELAERKLAEEALKISMDEVILLQEDLREQALHDAMTGLYNRRYMQDILVREFSRAARENHAISVIMVDMDGLKILNDTYGHNIGDRAIQNLGLCIKEMIRVEDVACRYGGDEFTLIMPKTSAVDASKRTEEWRAFLTADPIVVDENTSIVVKFTAGIASFPAQGKSVDDVTKCADIALYRAKERGRNCTVLFD